MGFIIYDTETTGTDAAFDQILQFAAIHVDDDFNIIDSIDTRCRRSKHIVPSAMAMAVTRQTGKDLEAPEQSHYEMMVDVQKWIAERSPAKIMGYNSVWFDEKFMRQAGYQSLLPPYVTNTNGNLRGDVLKMAQALHVSQPGVLNVPQNKKTGRDKFKLIELCKANGIKFSEDEAHDALADVKATLALMKKIKEVAPDFFAQSIHMMDKGQATQFLEDNPVVSLSEHYFGLGYHFPVTHIGEHEEYAGQHFAYDLKNDPDDYLDMSVEELTKVVKRARPRIVRTLRANAHLGLGDIDKVGKSVAKDMPDHAELMRRARVVHEHPTFIANMQEALKAARTPMAMPTHVEDKIFQGFPSPEDQAVMDKFHAAPWSKRRAIVSRFKDSRYKELGMRILWDHDPGLLTKIQQAKMTQWYKDRIAPPTGEAVPWRTLQSAIEEIGKEGAKPFNRRYADALATNGRWLIKTFDGTPPKPLDKKTAAAKQKESVRKKTKTKKAKKIADKKVERKEKAAKTPKKKVGPKPSKAARKPNNKKRKSPPKADRRRVINSLGGM
ncbi:MAG: exodeoxyribonuclease I [Alphaproteobacteria bacterium]